MQLFLVSYLASFSFIIQFCSNKGYRNRFLLRAVVFLSCQKVMVCFGGTWCFGSQGSLKQESKSFLELSAGGDALPRLEVSLEAERRKVSKVSESRRQVVCRG